MNPVVKLPSGKDLEITPTPFRVSNALFKAAIEKSNSVEVSGPGDILGLFRGVFLGGLADAKTESCLNECMKYALYGGLKIDKDTFEPMEAREDYLTVCWEVAHHNVFPFLKNPSALFERVLQTAASSIQK